MYAITRKRLWISLSCVIGIVALCTIIVTMVHQINGSSYVYYVDPSDGAMSDQYIEASARARALADDMWWARQQQRTPDEQALVQQTQRHYMEKYLKHRAEARAIQVEQERKATAKTHYQMLHGRSPARDTIVQRHQKLALEDSDPFLLALTDLQTLKTIQDLVESETSGELSVLERERLEFSRKVDNNVKLDYQVCNGMRQHLDSSITRQSACLLLELQDAALSGSAPLPIDAELEEMDPRLTNNSYDHFLLCTDSLISAMAVINSTISTYAQPERIVFHVVTEKHTRNALRTWLTLHQDSVLGEALVHVQQFEGKISELMGNTAVTKGRGSKNSIMQKYSNPFNHIRFYLPSLFPTLDRLMVFDDDIIVQQDLSRLFTLPFGDAVVLGVEDCSKKFSLLFNFSREEIIEAGLSKDECRFYLGFNMFNLQTWVEKDVTGTYESWLAKQKAADGALWDLGSLPPAMATFSGQVKYISPYWHLADLGWVHGLPPSDLEQVASLHWNGVYKPWQKAGFYEYKDLWLRHMDLDDPLYQKCNIGSLATYGM